ncbi:MAG: formyltransferase family protein [Candidatus Krumholzibacteriia bacterium]
MTAANRNRVVVLSGPDLVQRHTCATLIARGVNVVGICFAGGRFVGVPWGFLRSSIKRKGWRRTLSQVAGRLVYLAGNRRADAAIFRRLYDPDWIDRTLDAWQGQTLVARRYGDPETLAWLRSLAPDILVIHTAQFVGKQVREVPAKKLTIGGHPGLTPHYRGSHSAFWAVYNNRPQDLACTIFWLDGGYDTGDVIRQEPLVIEPGDSYVSLAWKGMIRQAEMQADVILANDDGVPIPRRSHPSIPADSYYDIPTLGDYLRYRRRQRRLR